MLLFFCLFRIFFGFDDDGDDGASLPSVNIRVLTFTRRQALFPLSNSGPIAIGPYIRQYPRVNAHAQISIRPYLRLMRLSYP
jgi:hypothetical protein